MASIESVSNGRKYNWGKNLLPFFDALKEKKMYEMKRDDDQKLAMLQNFIQQGNYAAPTMKAAGYTLNPLSTEERLLQSGKFNPYDVAESMANIEKIRSETDLNREKKSTYKFNNEVTNLLRNNMKGGRPMFMNFGVGDSSIMMQPGAPETPDTGLFSMLRKMISGEKGTPQVPTPMNMSDFVAVGVHPKTGRRLGKRKDGVAVDLETGEVVEGV